MVSQLNALLLSIQRLFLAIFTYKERNIDFKRIHVSKQMLLPYNNSMYHKLNFAATLISLDLFRNINSDFLNPAFRPAARN